jgi:hypothetical protein
VVNQRIDGQAQDDPSESEVSPGPRNDVPHGRQRWLSGWRWPLLGLGTVIAVLVIGAGVLYWDAKSGFAKTDPAQTSGDLARISPRVSGTVVRVLVDARLETIMIDLSTVSPEPSRGMSSPVLQSHGRMRHEDGALSAARATCAPEPSARSVRAAHAAGSGACTFGRWGACPFGRSWRLPDLSR